eukprot:scaffold4766_cov115-Isochrysis_galbana.AAC.12
MATVAAALELRWRRRPVGGRSAAGTWIGEWVNMCMSLRWGVDLVLRQGQAHRDPRAHHRDDHSVYKY